MAGFVELGGKPRGERPQGRRQGRWRLMRRDQAKSVVLGGDALV
jgi:hypothetical protein